MPDPISRALRYRERAEECRRLASIPAPSETGHYARIAEHYATLAEAEEKLAGISLSQARRALAPQDTPISTLPTPPPRRS
jgi:hypothetical protein